MKLYRIICLIVFITILQNVNAQNTTKRIILGHVQNGIYYTDIGDELIDSLNTFTAYVDFSGDKEKLVIKSKVLIFNFDIRHYNKAGDVQFVYEDPEAEPKRIHEIEFDFIDLLNTNDCFRITVNGLTNYYKVVVIRK